MKTGNFLQGLWALVALQLLCPWATALGQETDKVVELPTIVVRPTLNTIGFYVATKSDGSGKIEKMEVAKVISGSPADKAGVRRRDVLVSICHTPVQGLTITGILKILQDPANLGTDLGHWVYPIQLQRGLMAKRLVDVTLEVPINSQPEVKIDAKAAEHAFIYQSSDGKWMTSDPYGAPNPVGMAIFSFLDYKLHTNQPDLLLYRVNNPKYIPRNSLGWFIPYHEPVKGAQLIISPSNWKVTRQRMLAYIAELEKARDAGLPAVLTPP